MFAQKRAGRPRKVGVPRNPKTGNIASAFERETPEQAKAIALEARLRQQWGVETVLKLQRQQRGAEAALSEARRKMDNPLLGYALGRLCYSGEIDRKQHDAGSYFVWLWKTHARLTGAPSPNVRSIGADMTGGGISCHPEDSDDWANDMKRLWRDTYRYIFDANGDHGRTSGPIFEILKRVLVEDLGPENAAELGALKVGLNAINRARGA